MGGMWSPDVNPTYRSDMGGSYEFNVGSTSGSYTTQYLGSCGVPPTFLPEVPMFIDSNKEAVTISAGEVAINMGKLELHSVLTLATKDDVACAESWISLSDNSNACRSTYGLKVGTNGDTGSTHGTAKNSGGIQLLKKGSVSYSTALAAGSTVVVSVSSTRGQAGDMVIATATNYQDNSISGYQHFTWHGTMTSTDGSIGHGDSSRSAWAILLKNVCTPCGYVAPLITITLETTFSMILTQESLTQQQPAISAGSTKQRKIVHLTLLALVKIIMAAITAKFGARVQEVL